MVKAFDDIKKEVLQFLFEKYMESGTGKYSVYELLTPYEMPVEDFVSILKQDELIEEGLAESSPHTYSITVKGINEVDPDYFADRLASIMNELGLGNLEWVSVTEVTGIHDVKRVQDIGSVLEVTDFFEIERRADNVMAKLTPKGKAYFEEHRKEFI